MAEISFLAGEDFTIQNTNGSGLGFYASGGFGYPVAVGEYQGRTFITSAAGTSQGPEVDNVKYLNEASGILGQTGSGIALTAIPNYQATLNIRFTHSSAVQVQNAELRIYDRSNVNNDPSGVLCQVAEIIHPDIVQDNNGSGDTSWINAHGSGVTVDLVDGPGVSGLSPNGASTSETDHDWYVSLSASPSTIGSKTQFGLYISLEYL